MKLQDREAKRIEREARREELVAKVRLRKKQYDAAMAGDAKMQIFLGKLWLGQSDHPETVDPADIAQPVSVTIMSGDARKRDI